MLDKAKLRLPQTPELWLEAVRLEARAGTDPNPTLAKALQECPASGLLWAEAITRAPKPQRKTKSLDAMKKCENDPDVVLAVAHLFLSERKIAKVMQFCVSLQC